MSHVSLTSILISILGCTCKQKLSRGLTKTIVLALFFSNAFGGVFSQQHSAKTVQNTLTTSKINYCSNNLILYQPQHNVMVSNTVVKAQSITAANSIKNPAVQVQYYASNFIDLLPQENNEGFYTEDNIEFLAEIVPCEFQTEAMTINKPIEENAAFKPLKEEVKNKVIIYSMYIYPNPVEQEWVNVAFNLEEPSTLDIELFDLRGRLIIREQGTVEYSQGQHIKTFELKGILADVYILKVRNKKEEKTFKLIKK